VTGSGEVVEIWEVGGVRNRKKGGQRLETKTSFFFPFFLT
jgi:hypothetical protein